MSDSAFAALQASLVAALQAAMPPGVVVHANRVRPVARESARNILVRRVVTREAPGGSIGCTDWITSFSVMCMAKPTASEPDPDTAADELLQLVWGAIKGLSLPDAIDITAEPAIDWDFDASETTSVGADLRLNVLHRTQANTLQPWSA